MASSDTTIDLKIPRNLSIELKTLIKAAQKRQLYRDSHDFDFTLLKQLTTKQGQQQFRNLQSKKPPLADECRIIDKGQECRLFRFSKANNFCELHSLVSISWWLINLETKKIQLIEKRSSDRQNLLFLFDRFFQNFPTS